MTLDPAESLKALGEALRSWKIWTLVLLVTLASLFFPHQVAASLGIEGLRNQFRPWLGVAALVSAAGLMIFFGSGLEARWNLRKETKKAYAQLRNLTGEEKVLLAPYLAEQTNTQYFDIRDGIATGLQSRGILYRPTNLGNLLRGFAFNLQPWARSELEKHPELLRLSEEEKADFDQETALE